MLPFFFLEVAAFIGQYISASPWIETHSLETIKSFADTRKWTVGLTVYFITCLNTTMISILIQAADLIIPVAEQQINHLGRVTPMCQPTRWNNRQTHTLERAETNSTQLSLIAKDQFHGGENLSLLQKILAVSSEDLPWVATAPFLYPMAK